MSFNTFYLNSENSGGIIDGSNVVVGGRLGVSIDPPLYTLDVSGTTRSNNLIANTATITNLDISGETVNIKSLQTKVESTEFVTMSVIVGTKTSKAFNSSGSSNGYFINNIETPYLHFTSGKTYRFDQSNSTNSSHPILFYLDEAKTSQYSTGVTTNPSSNYNGGTSGNYVEISITSNTPNILYYQCQNHSYMGGKIYVKGSNVTSITSVGTLTAGTWNAAPINKQYINTQSISINDLSNVNYTASSMTEGQTLVWNPTGQNWVPGTIALDSLPSSIYLNGGKSKVMEKIAGVCDGRTISGEMTNYTLQSVSTYQDISTTLVDVQGSSITYSPPTNVSQVVYTFVFNIVDISNEASMFNQSNDLTIRFYIDGTEVTNQKAQISSYLYNNGSIYTFTGIIDIGNVSSNDIANGKLVSWATGKTLKLKASNSEADYPIRIFAIKTVSSNQYISEFIPPTLQVSSIGNLNTYPFENTTINDLSDVSFNSTTTTDGQALVWNSTDAVWEAGVVASSGGLTDLSANINDISLNISVLEQDILDVSSIASNALYNDIAISRITNLQSKLNTIDSSINDISNLVVTKQSILTAGTNITIVGNTISASGGITDLSATSINDLSDVSFNSTTTTNGQALVWDSTNKVWEAGTVSSSSSSFINLADTPSTFTANKFLAVNSSGNAVEFVDAPETGTNIDETTDISLNNLKIHGDLSANDASFNNIDTNSITVTSITKTTQLDASSVIVDGTTKTTQLDASSVIVDGTTNTTTLISQSTTTKQIDLSGQTISVDVSNNVSLPDLKITKLLPAVPSDISNAPNSSVGGGTDLGDAKNAFRYAYIQDLFISSNSLNLGGNAKISAGNDGNIGIGKTDENGNAISTSLVQSDPAGQISPDLLPFNGLIFSKIFTPSNTGNSNIVETELFNLYNSITDISYGHYIIVQKDCSFSDATLHNNIFIDISDNDLNVGDLLIYTNNEKFVKVKTTIPTFGIKRQHIADGEIISSKLDTDISLNNITVTNEIVINNTNVRSNILATISDVSVNIIDISENRKDISENRKDISENRKDISENRKDISDISLNITVLEQDILDVSSIASDALYKDIAISRITNLQSKLNTIDSSINDISNLVITKQSTLTAGTNITIVGNTISASGGITDLSASSATDLSDISFNPATVSNNEPLTWNTTTHSWEPSTTMSIDTINENTSNNGVIIDNLTLKNGSITVPADISAHRVFGVNYFVGNKNIVSASAQANFNDLEVKNSITNTSTLLVFGQSEVMELSGTFKTDIIEEKTNNNGVVIEGVTIKNNSITAGTNGSISATNFNIGSRNIVSAAAQANFTDLEVKNSITNDVTLLVLGQSGVMELSGTFKTDIIEEKTSNSGVNIEDILIKDGDISANDVSFNNIHVLGDISFNGNLYQNGSLFQSGSGGGGLTDLSATSISDLSDVSFNSTTTSEGATLAWNTSEQLWKPSSVTNSIGVNMNFIKYDGLTTVSVSQSPEVELTMYRITITPTSTNSVIELKYNLFGYIACDAVYRIVREVGGNSTEFYNTNKGDVAWSGIVAPYYQQYGSTPFAQPILFYDEPNTTSEITYKLTINNSSATTSTYYVNQGTTPAGTNNSGESGISTVSVIEHPKTKTLVPATSITKQGQVLETLAGVCDGRTVVVESGSYTLPNVTAYQDTTTSWTDVVGSSITYTPPSGAKQVLFDFHLSLSTDTDLGTATHDARAVLIFKLLIDNTEVSSQNQEWGDDQYSWGDNFFYRGIFDITGTNDIANGKLSSWTSSKTIKLMVASLQSNYAARLHANRMTINSSNVATLDTNTLIKPRLKITSIGESSGQAVTLTNNSVSDLSDISFNSTSTTDGQALVWNSTDGVWEAGTVASGGGGGVSSGDDISFNNLDISGVLGTNKSNNEIKLGGHIIPTTNSTYDLGSAEYKIRHLFLSSNSLWVGENHKIEISDGKMKFRKLQKDTLPSGLSGITGASLEDAVAVLGKTPGSNASAFSLADWEAYSIAKGNPLKIDDIFQPDDINDDDGLTDTINSSDISFNVVDASGLNVFGTASMQSIIPPITNTYSLGSSTHVWKDVYIGPGSLYIDGQKVLESDADTIVVGADANQNLKLNTTGTGVLQMESAAGIQISSTGSGNIELGSTGTGIVRITDNLALNGNVEIFNDSSDMVKINDSLLVTGDISFNGNLYKNGTLFTGGSTIDETTDVSLNNLIVHGDLSANDASFNVIDATSLRINGVDIIDGAPSALDTLSELAAALDNSANFATNVLTTLSNKQDTLIAGTNITITGNTISASGGGGLTDLSASSISDLSDVSLNGIQVNQTLKWDGEKLVPTTLATSITKQGQVLETLTGLCDGRSITVESGTYTLPTAVHQVWGATDHSMKDVDASIINYKPPTGTKQFIYYFTFMFSYISGSSGYTNGAYQFLIDGNKIGNTFVMESGRYECSLMTFKLVVDIGGTTDYANNRISSWNSLKQIKVQMCERQTATRGWTLHYNVYATSTDYDFLGSTPAVDYPIIRIQAIGETSGQSVTLTNNSVSDLSDISFNSTSTTDGQALVWNSTDGVWEAGTVASGSGGGSSQWTTNGSNIYYNSGNVGIGTTGPLSKLHVLSPTGGYAFQIEHQHSGGDFRLTINNDELNIWRKSGGTYYATGMYLNYNGGSVYYSGSNAISSDNRMKHNETEIINALDTINKLKIYKYFKTNYKRLYDVSHNFTIDSSGNPITQDNYTIEAGVISQDILNIPELKYVVKEGSPTDASENHYAVLYNEIFVYNLKATQELHQLVESQQTTIQTQQATIQEQQEEIENLKLVNQDLNNQFNNLKQEIQAIKQHLGI